MGSGLLPAAPSSPRAVLSATVCIRVVSVFSFRSLLSLHSSFCFRFWTKLAAMLIHV